MTPEQWVLILGGIGTFLGVILAAYRSVTGDKFNRKVSESAALLSGYTEMVKNLRLELKEVHLDNDAEVVRSKKQCAEDMARLERLHKQELDALMAIYAEERKQWELQRTRMVAQFEEDRARWNEARLELKERIDGLDSQVYVLRNRPTESKDRAEDKE
jgi:hypothetical protein